MYQIPLNLFLSVRKRPRILKSGMKHCQAVSKIVHTFSFYKDLYRQTFRKIMSETSEIKYVALSCKPVQRLFRLCPRGCFRHHPSYSAVHVLPEKDKLMTTSLSCYVSNYEITLLSYV